MQFFPVCRHSAVVVSSGSTSFHLSFILLPVVSYFYFSFLFLLKIYFSPLSPVGHILLGRLIKSIKETLRFSVSCNFTLLLTCSAALISFKLCFSLFPFYFVVFLFHSVMGCKRGRKNGKNGKKSPPKKKYRTKKKAYTRRYVPLKEDPQPDRSRGASHKEKDLNNWPEENMLPGTFMFQSLLSDSTHSLWSHGVQAIWPSMLPDTFMFWSLLPLLLVSFAASPVAALHFTLTSQQMSCRPILMSSCLLQRFYLSLLHKYSI